MPSPLNIIRYVKKQRIKSLPIFVTDVKVNFFFSQLSKTVMSVSSFATSSGGDTRVARDDERQNAILPVRPINGVCRVYIAPPPVADDTEMFCRICHDTKSENNTPLISPCRCTGTSALVHQVCMENWLTLSGRESCDLCNYRLPVYRTLKPIREVSYAFGKAL